MIEERKIIRFTFGTFLFIVFLLGPLMAQPTGELPATPPGKHFGLKAEGHVGARSFKSGEPVVGTTYFYWYDAPSKTHILNGDGSDALTDHPVDLEKTSYKSEAWHAGQLRDIRAAGIDFLIPVYWGVPGQYDTGHFSWSFQGLPPLVAAHDALLKEGGAPPPPAIGMFYDTSILQHNSFNKNGSTYHVDLTTDFGKEWFYTAIRDFFSLIPPSKWARVDGRPIVFLYSAHYAKAQDPLAMDHVTRRFREDFGVAPYLVKHVDWLGQADAVYGWGGAVSMRLNLHVAAIGPGYDHSAVPGREPLIVDREGGATYRRRWENLLALDPARRPWMVHVETWNEWHEGTDVAESLEYGRAYIDLTRRYAQQWRENKRLPVRGKYVASDRVDWRPGQARGLTPRESSGDGFWEIIESDGVQAMTTRPNKDSSSRFLYYLVDDSFIFDGPPAGQRVEVDVTFRDAGCEAFLVEYDNSDLENGEGEGAFRDSKRVSVGATGAWKTVTIPLPDARFVDRCNTADFRLTPFGGDLLVREVVLRKVK